MAISDCQVHKLSGHQTITHYTHVINHKLNKAQSFYMSEATHVLACVHACVAMATASRHGNGVAMAWQYRGNSKAGARQQHIGSMATHGHILARARQNTRQEHDHCLAIARHSHGNSMGIAWQSSSGQRIWRKGAQPPSRCYCRAFDSLMP